jgi:hypothetical protein
MNKSKTQVIKDWTLTYSILVFMAMVTTALTAKFGIWMLLMILFTWANLFALHLISSKQQFLLSFIDDKASSSINLLAESIILQSKDLTAIHNWIKSVSYPKTSTKLH